MITNDLIEKLSFFTRCEGLSIFEIQNITKSSRRNIVHHINLINDLLNDYTNIVIEENDTLSIKSQNIRYILKDIILSKKKFIFQNERPYMIIVYLFIKNEFISMKHLTELVGMSKNTVLNDLSEIEQIKGSINITISYDRQTGYNLVGSRTNQRRLVELALSYLLKMISGETIIEYICETLNIKLKDQEIRDILSIDETINIVDDKLNYIAHLFAILNVNPINENKEKRLTTGEINYLEQTAAHQTTINILKSFPKLSPEKHYISTQLISVIEENLDNLPNQYFISLMERIINNFTVYAGVPFHASERFRKNLYNHLVPAYYRIKLGVASVNPYKQQMLTEYKELFYLMKKSLKPLSDDTGIELTDDEVAYFVMHFGGYLLMETRHNDFKSIRAVVVCPHSVGTSILITELLTDAMPEIEFIKYSSESFHRVGTLIERADFIISTHKINTSKPLYIINPGFEKIELGLLKRKIYSEFNIKTESMRKSDEIVNILEGRYNISEDISLKIEIDYVLDNNLVEKKIVRRDYNLTDYLTEDKLHFFNDMNSWEQVIKEGSKVLVDQDYIEESYIDGMIQSVKDYGPYIEIAPKVAMPHSRPEMGAKKLGISFVRLAEPVLMGNEEKKVPIYLFFIISIPDKNSHLKLLKDLHQLVDNSENVKRLMQAEDKQELISIFKGKLNV